MGRAPCCEKLGLKRGPWTRDEDQLLINYINENGHGNWRALPKKAGLLRCGKSCRLRWTNYLRPDIKRGNFSKEDEDAIIELHKELGNKWSAIAARLPGRTDNEIKNIWHTHLKKRLNPPPETVKRIRKRANINPVTKKDAKLLGDKAAEMTTTDQHESLDSTMTTADKNESLDSPMEDGSENAEPNSPLQSSSENSSSVTNNDTTNGSTMSDVISDTIEKFLEVDDDFWSDVISGDYSNITSCDISGVNSEPPHVQSWSSPIKSTADVFDFDPNTHDDDMEFWYNIFTRDGEIQDLLEL